MDMRTRLERKIDKMWSQRQRMMDIETRMKTPLKETIKWNNNDKENNRLGLADILPKRRLLKAKDKRKAKVHMSSKKETQTLIQTKKEFFDIGSGRPSLKADSAGHKLDANYRLRMDQRLLLVSALTDSVVPRGAKNAFSIAIRIESPIYRVLGNQKDYFKYCNIVSSYIRSAEHIGVRHSLLMGWTVPEEFAFVPSIGTDLREKIVKRLEQREQERDSEDRMDSFRKSDDWPQTIFLYLGSTFRKFSILFLLSNYLNSMFNFHKNHPYYDQVVF